MSLNGNDIFGKGELEAECPAEQSLNRNLRLSGDNLAHRHLSKSLQKADASVRLNNKRRRSADTASVQVSTSTEDDIQEPSPSRSDFKSQIMSYTYSPRERLQSPPDMTPLTSNAPITPNPRKRRAEAASTSTSTRPKLQSTSTSASASDLPAVSTSTKRSSARKALRTADPYSPVNNLVDSIRPGLMLLMIGLNPGLMTAQTGHAYAHPSNHFWKLMHSSGLTDRRHLPSETHDLMDLYSIGNTNLCLRPTRDGAGLSKEELEAGVPVLEEKVKAYRPEVVCIVGKGIWETIVRVKVRNGARKQAKSDFQYGWQDESLWLGSEVDKNGKVLWAGARTFVATSTSGLAANTTPAEKAIIWKELGDWIGAKRAGVAVKAEEHNSVKLEDEAESCVRGAVRI